MSILGVIHARGGSRRIPRKNIKLLNGLPLIAYVTQAAKLSQIDRLIVSTDDEGIGHAARRFGAEFLFHRPSELSDDVPSELVTLHALEWMEKNQNLNCSIVVTLQPTTPFVLTEDINGCIDTLLTNPKLSSCFTARRVTEHPEWMYSIEPNKNMASLFVKGKQNGYKGVSQYLPMRYLANGAAFATRVPALIESRQIIAEPTLPFVMPTERSLDIDEPIDWNFAEFMIRGKNSYVGSYETR